MIAVTGIGPRCGTSFVMRELKKYIPIVGRKFPSWSIKEENPKGYYEIDRVIYSQGIPFHKWKNHGVKVWPHVLVKTKPEYISKIILLERFDTGKQVESTIRVKNKELEKIPWIKIPDESVPKLIEERKEMVEDYLSFNSDIPVLRIFTEDLNDNLEVIEEFVSLSKRRK